ncbi:hypothetical protein FOA52_002773 [Chlamydomonas sp. UWO 241]|nr:hypothetical protein FOA52_002773 [Chlamydomonas sp. UWO 241]
MVKKEEPDVMVVDEDEDDEKPELLPAQPMDTGAPRDQANSEWTGTFTWRVEGITKPDTVDGQRKSARFEVANYYWQLLLFPFSSKQSGFLSLFLDAPDSPWTPAAMTPTAAFKLTLVNQIDPAKSFHKEAKHTFTQHQGDWGFTQFMKVVDVTDPAAGFIVNDTAVFTVEVTVTPAVPFKDNTRAETGYVGLKNQGATCYMNSLLQYMYNLPFLRTAVYHMPTSENDEACKSLPLALQSLFYKLQHSKGAVSTKDLTKSFGWGTYDAFMQHDVQELNRVLCEKLEEKMKGTKVERVINELFEGHTYNYIDCIGVDYKSTRKESFLDLQLDIKGCANVLESFARYVDVETLSGPNQYVAEGHGLQDAHKGVLFESLPPVLQLQLKRFEYDVQRDAMTKINDRYEFPDELDLDFDDRRLFSPTADKSVRNLYKLHSVLVHSGGVNGGHYYAFVRPDGSQWLKFDDDRVDSVDGKRAMEEQYGGDDDSMGSFGGGLKYAKNSNAYMLVYVRQSDWDKVMGDSTEEELAGPLRERLEQEQCAKEEKQKMKQEAFMYCTLKVATDRDILDQVGASGQCFDLVNHDKLPSDRIFRVKKNLRFSEFKQMVADKLDVPVTAQRYWIWSARPNSSFRPQRILTAKEEEMPMMELREHRDQRMSAASKMAVMDIKLLLEVPQQFNTTLKVFEPRYEQQLQPKTATDILVFFKHYDPTTHTLRFIGRSILSIETRLTDMAARGLLARLCGMEEGVPIEVYEEVKAEPTIFVDLLNMQLTFKQAQLKDGDILIIQRAVSNTEVPELPHPTVKHYLEYVRSRRVVSFKALEEPSEGGIQLDLNRDMDYEQVTRALSEHLNLPSPDVIRLTQHNAWNRGPQRNPLRSECTLTLESLLTHSKQTNECLYYEVLDMPLAQMEKLKAMRVSYHGPKAEFVAEHRIRVPRESCVGDLLTELARQLGPSHASAGQPLRLVEVINNKLYKVCDKAEALERIDDGYWNLRAEVVPEDQRGPMAEGERLVPVAHFNVEESDTSNGSAHPAHPFTFGHPFLMLVRDDEPLSSLRARIKAKLGTSTKEFDKWRFAYMQGGRAPPAYFEEEEAVGVRFKSLGSGNGLAAEAYIGMQHDEKETAGGRRTGYRASTLEKAIKIKSYYAHVIVLATQSEYYKGRLGQDSSRFKPDVQVGCDSGGGNSRIAIEIMEVVEQEEDVEAMEALLRTTYGAQVMPATDALVLLRAARLADRFLVSQAVAQVLASCLADVPITAISDDVLALVFDAHSASLATTLPMELMDKCRVYLRTAFRKVPDVVTQPALLERFLALPHAAVVAWAQSDSLQVHSENEVVYLLSAWVKAQETAGLPCSAEQLELLVHSVRLADCGPSCLQMIVPALDWFKSSRTVLGKFVVSRALETAAMKYSKDTAVPAAWLADTPREKLASCEAVVEFQVNAGRLEWLYAAENNRINLDSVCVNGFWMTAFLLSRASDTSPGELTLGCHTKIDIAKTTKAVSRSAHVAVAFSLLMKVGKAARRGPTNFIVDANGRGYGDALSASAASVASLVAPHLEGDQLKGKVSFSNVDLLHIRGRRPLEWLVHAQHARSYYAHAIVLASASDYFKGHLGEDSSRFKTDAVGGGSSGSRIVFEIVEAVEHVADVGAMDALLRSMYGATMATDVLMLLRALHPADRCLVSQAVAQLLASRLADVPADAITDDVLALALDAHSASLATPLPLELMDKCRVNLRTVFCNVPDVVTQPALLERFLALQHAAVVAWAKSDSL